MSDTMQFDVLIVGAGPAGLSAAIALKTQSPDLGVCVLEKASEIGGHSVSGAVMDPRALDELLPDWRDNIPSFMTPVIEDRFTFLTKEHAFNLPTPKTMHNKGNFMLSLSAFCRWLGEQATALGVEIYPGFAAASLCFDEGGQVIGVRTGDMGLDHEKKPLPTFMPGIQILAKHTLLGEGCRGSLSEEIIKHFGLREPGVFQTYGLGIKEVWEVQSPLYQKGMVQHTVGWPLDFETYGGSFIYHMPDNKVAIGFVVGLDYKNPTLSPYEEFQRFKTHPSIKPLLKGGLRISYAARALNEGGIQSLPKLSFPGGMLIGCSAGFLNVPRIKGIHGAIKSGLEAANAILKDETYDKRIQQSWLYKELHQARNVRPAFKWGLVPGLIYSVIDQYLLGGRAPWTLHHKESDNQATLPLRDVKKISYGKPDGEITFDRLSSVFLSNTNHRENQPCHLALKDPEVALRVNYDIYGSPEQYYCPAGVYEIIEENNEVKLQINAQNCIHCKTCDIKDVTQNISWKTPEGGGGPIYTDT